MAAAPKYPQAAYPYADLAETNRRRTKNDMEYELLDTGIFDDDRYFDVFVEYAKDGPEDILVRITAANRGPQPAELHLLPTLWFRRSHAIGDRAGILRPGQNLLIQCASTFTWTAPRETTATGLDISGARTLQRIGCCAPHRN